MFKFTNTLNCITRNTLRGSQWVAMATVLTNNSNFTGYSLPLTPYIMKKVYCHLVVSNHLMADVKTTNMPRNIKYSAIMTNRRTYTLGQLGRPRHINHASHNLVVRRPQTGFHYAGTSSPKRSLNCSKKINVSIV